MQTRCTWRVNPFFLLAAAARAARLVLLDGAAAGAGHAGEALGGLLAQVAARRALDVLDEARGGVRVRAGDVLPRFMVSYLRTSAVTTVAPTCCQH